MLEQEITSLVAFVLNAAGNPTAYYGEVPEGFLVPSVYFPAPEIVSKGDTLNSYALEYTWFIKFFHTNTSLAYSLARPVLTAVKQSRNLIPLLDSEGNKLARGFRIHDPLLLEVEDADDVMQLQLSWRSCRPYVDPEVEKMMVYDLNVYGKVK